jgi:hypothetical protein
MPDIASPISGPSEVRWRVGFRPTSPQWLAGIRIDPPPSLACAIETMPEATAAAAPPLEPPGVCSVFQGFSAAPYACDSVVGRMPSSGTFVLPIVTKPASRKRAPRKVSTGARKPMSFSVRVPR